MIEVKTFKKSNAENNRIVLKIDDSTGVIEVICWMSLNENYSEISKLVKLNFSLIKEMRYFTENQRTV